MIRVRWLLGTALYFASIGLWFLIMTWLLCWLILFALPSLCIGWLIGWLSRSFTRKPKRWDAFRSLSVWETVRLHYFEYSLHGPGRSIVEHNSHIKNLMFTVYPHGVLPWTAIFYWGLNPAHSDVTPCIHSSIFYIPLLRELAGWMGCVNVSANSIKRALARNGRIIMAPGGIADISNTGNTVHRRYGFLRVAKETGASVVPIWIPEERSYYHTWMPLGRSLERVLRYPLPLFIWGRTFFPFLPRRIKTRIYVGEAFSLENMDVDTAYDHYYKVIEQLQQLAI